MAEAGIGLGIGTYVSAKAERRCTALAQGGLKNLNFII